MLPSELYVDACAHEGHAEVGDPLGRGVLAPPIE
jgi:hypothetical protein